MGPLTPDVSVNWKFSMVFTSAIAVSVVAITGSWLR